jgi:surface polysaccharide O-acyltransferase-like enzyme
MSKKVVLSLLVLGVFLLHQDFWNWRNGGLVLGFLPVGLAYHAAYAILSAAMMWVLVKFAWPKQLDEMESGSEQSSKEERK